VDFFKGFGFVETVDARSAYKFNKNFYYVFVDDVCVG
jgi:hypothetical protein